MCVCVLHCNVAAIVWLSDGALAAFCCSARPDVDRRRSLPCACRSLAGGEEVSGRVRGQFNRLELCAVDDGAKGGVCWTMGRWDGKTLGWRACYIYITLRLIYSKVVSPLVSTGDI